MSFNKDIANIFCYKKAFTVDECQKIIDIPQAKDFIYDNENEWIWQRMQNFVKLANSDFYKFKILYIDNLNVKEYKKDDFFKWHTDINVRELFALRKISIVIFLSDNNDYEGGNLLFNVNDETETPEIDMEQGSMIMFPSFQIHKVSNIKIGTRKTLIAWIYGDSFS